MEKVQAEFAAELLKMTQDPDASNVARLELAYLFEEIDLPISEIPELAERPAPFSPFSPFTLLKPSH